MMQVRVKIRREVKQYFDQFGSLSYCVDRLFNEMGENAFGLDIVATPSTETNLCTTTVTVTSPVYIAYVREFDNRHKFVSVAKLLTYAYERDYCKNWAVVPDMTEILQRINKLPANEKSRLLAMLKEQYEK